MGNPSLLVMQIIINILWIIGYLHSDILVIVNDSRPIFAGYAHAHTRSLIVDGVSVERWLNITYQLSHISYMVTKLLYRASSLVVILLASHIVAEL